MKNGFLLAIFLMAAMIATDAQSAGKYWQQQVDYAIAVSLNDTNHTLEGYEKINYHNYSPDSLDFIWIHLWPNAYKNDKTAYSEQKIRDGQIDFYFSNNDEKGYINRLDFKTDGVSLLTEDHPQYIDVVKLVLPKPLPPGDSITIQTSFHVKLPYRFSRMGYVDQNYSLTQWYPKVAVYDKDGWHPMPYLEWGEYYNDFGNYDVQITLPSNYVTGATGTLQNTEEVAWLKAHTKAPVMPASATKKDLFAKKEKPFIPSSRQTKTLHYTAQQVTDFAWFADKNFIVKYDTIQLNNSTIDVWNYVLPGEEKKWSNSVQFTKNAIRFYTAQLGAYPYPQVSVVCDALRYFDGMEYPMITILNTTGKEQERELDVLVAHEVGHNWFQAILSTNERSHTWMDEGMNTYIEQKYRRYYYPSPPQQNFIKSKLPADEYKALLDAAISTHRDQPITTPSEGFTSNNYNASAYEKTSEWMNLLEKRMGDDKMSLLMDTYYKEWKFKHPQPSDFKALATNIAGQSTDADFALLDTTGLLEQPVTKKTRVTAFFNFNNTATTKYIGISPAIGINNYDKASIGLLIHNYNLPANPFEFIVTPMFATGSKQLVGYAKAGYTFYPKGKLQQAALYASGARFNTDNGIGINNEKVFKAFSKITPGFYLELKKTKPTASLVKWMDVKAWIINEQQLEQKQQPAPADSLYYTARSGSITTVIPQVSFGLTNNRGLYPWNAELSVQQVKQIVRTTIAANYFLNFNAAQQGIAVRFFFGKIFYTQQKTDQLRANNSRYHFTMYGPNGVQDYTYSNAFAERNQSTDLFGRQIMLRDGGFKYRSDYSAVQPGLKTNSLDFFDNWLSSVNVEIDIPRKINPLAVLPFNMPLRLFADVGTSASPWQANSDMQKFLYSIGLEVQLFKVLKVYYPFIQSSAFKEPNSVNDPTKPGGPSWWQKWLTFSVDLKPLKNMADNILLQ